MPSGVPVAASASLSRATWAYLFNSLGRCSLCVELSSRLRVAIEVRRPFSCITVDEEGASSTDMPVAAPVPPKLTELLLLVLSLVVLSPPIRLLSAAEVAAQGVPRNRYAACRVRKRPSVATLTLSYTPSATALRCSLVASCLDSLSGSRSRSTSAAVILPVASLVSARRPRGLVSRNGLSATALFSTMSLKN